MAVGIGLAFSNARAVLEALVGIKSEFVRTPKYRVETTTDATWKRKKYRRKRGLLPLLELASALYFLCAMLYAAHMGLWLTLPFLSLFFFGYAYIGTMSLLQNVNARRLFALFRPLAFGRR
jgi:hypothetical protein